MTSVPQESVIPRQCRTCGQWRDRWAGDGSFTYAMRRGEFVKIGKSRTPLARLRVLQRRPHTVVCPPDMDFSLPLTLVGVCEGPEAEHSLHEFLRDEHVVGEWFRGPRTDNQAEAFATAFCAEPVSA